MTVIKYLQLHLRKTAETNIIWYLYLCTFIGIIIKHGGAKDSIFFEGLGTQHAKKCFIL